MALPGRCEVKPLRLSVRVLLRALGFAWLFFGLLLSGCYALAQPVAEPAAPSPQSAAQAPAFLPLPDLKTPLRVLVVDNERLPSLSRADVQAVLAQTAQLLKTHFAIEPTFELQQEPWSIQKLFRLIPKQAAPVIDRALYDFKQGKGDVALLTTRTAKLLVADGENTARSREFARPYLQTQPDETAESFAAALVQAQLERIALWHSSAQGASAAIDDAPYNEFVYWQFLGLTTLPYELVITNQILASVEYSSNSVHSAIRGGLTNGATFPSIQSKTGAYSVVSTYPFLATDTSTLSLRDGAFANPQERNNAIAVLAAHELGHQLLHLGHPFGNSACIMTPTELLHFRRWLAALDGARCTLGSSLAMQSGKLIRFPDYRGRKTIQEVLPND